MDGSIFEGAFFFVSTKRFDRLALLGQNKAEATDALSEYRPEGGRQIKEGMMTSLTLSSPAFSEKERVPDRYTCTGEDVSPPLVWTGVPENARSMAMVVSDPDAPAGTWYHWGIFDIPPTLGGLHEGFPTDELHDGIRQSLNDFERMGYGGPCPPKGHGIHHYRFTLLALGVKSLPLSMGVDNRDVETAAAQHVIARAVLCGTYSRP